MVVGSLKFIFLLFAMYAFKCGLVSCFGMENLLAIFISIIVSIIYIAFRPIVIIISIERSFLLPLFLIDLLIIIPGIWGACVAWDWNVILSILGFIVVSFICVG